MSKLYCILFFVCFSILIFGQEKPHKIIKYPEGYTSQIDVVYKTENGWNGRIDIYSNPTSKKPTPIVLNIHGGGWNHGEKESQGSFNSFFKNGYAVANVEYRLVDVSPAPAAIEDVRCALIYLYNTSKALNIDTNKIVIMGGSSGGHLALMAGLLGDNNIFDSDCKYTGKLKIAAIINKYGVTDLVPLTKWKSAKRWLASNFGNIEFTKSVSPLYYVNKNSPPVFIIHGDADPVVPYNQSVKLYNALIENNVKTEFMTIKDGLHGKFTKAQKQEFSKQMFIFLDEIF